MKTSYTYIIVILFASIGFISCESDMEVKGLENINPKLVLNAVFTAERDTSHVYLTRSRSVFSNPFRYGSIWYGDENGVVPAGSFRHLKDADVSVWINDRKESASYYQQDSTYLLERKLKAGDQIHVEVVQNGDKAFSSVVIPELPEILSVDTATFTQSQHSWTGDFLRFRVKIKDKGGVKNYYRLTLQKQYAYYYYNDWSYTQYYSAIYTDDPVLVNGFFNGIEDSDIELGNNARNDLYIFTDNLFDGGEYTLDFYTNKLKADSYTPQVKTVVSIQAISEDLYYYYHSFLKYKYADETLNEPVVMYNNIEGGLGIVGAINEKLILYHEETYDEEEESNEWYW